MSLGGGLDDGKFLWKYDGLWIPGQFFRIPDLVCPDYFFYFGQHLFLAGNQPKKISKV